MKNPKLSYLVNDLKGERGKWNDESIEEVEEFKYLGYLFNRNNNPNTHIKEVYSKAITEIKTV